MTNSTTKQTVNRLAAIKLWVLTWLELGFKAIPSLVIASYCVFCYRLFLWYSVLPSPSASQTTFATAVFGLGSAVFGLYLNSGIKWNEHIDTIKSQIRDDQGEQ